MAQRWTLPAISLADLAARSGVALPERFRPPDGGDPDDAAAAQAALVEAHAVDAAGTAAPPLAEALVLLADPGFTVEIALTPTQDLPVPEPGEPARAWTAVLAAGTDRLAVLLRRDRLPLVEISDAALTELPRELHRLLDTLPEHTSRHRDSIVVPLELIPLVQQAGTASPDVVAQVEDVDTGRVEAVARLLRTANATLDLRVVGAGEPPLLGQVLWYSTPDGWVALEPAPDEPGTRMVRLRPVAAADAVPALAPLIDAVLPSVAR